MRYTHFPPSKLPFWGIHQVQKKPKHQIVDKNDIPMISSLLFGWYPQFLVKNSLLICWLPTNQIHDPHDIFPLRFRCWNPHEIESPNVHHSVVASHISTVQTLCRPSIQRPCNRNRLIGGTYRIYKAYAIKGYLRGYAPKLWLYMVR